MKKVLLRGPILSRSGYGEHSRQIFRYLLSKENIDLRVQPLPWGITPWYLNHSDENGLIGEIMKRSVLNENEKMDITIQVQLPNEWDVTLGEYNVGVTAGIETTASNPIWVSTHCEKMDKVIVPSKHAKKSLLNSASTSTPIHVIPECFYDEILEEPSPIDLNLTTKFNFLTIGVLTGFTPDTDRKNLMYLAKWFVENFHENKDVGLVIKTNRGRETTIDRKGTEDLLSRILKEIGYKGAPKIYLLHGAMSRKEMTALYKEKSIKAFVSLTRGEGFGLPHLEAAAAGLPVIATNWSAHKEFLDMGKWLQIDYDLVNVHESRIDNQIFMKNSKWASVKEKDFKRTVSTFYEKPHKPKEWALDLSKKIKKEFSFDSISRKYDEVLGEILS